MRYFVFLVTIIILTACKAKKPQNILVQKILNSSEKIDQFLFQLNQIDSLVYLWIQSGNDAEIKNLISKKYPLDRRIKINNELEFYPIY